MNATQVIELGSMQTVRDAAGYPTGLTFSRSATVFGGVKSANRNEFYSAMSAGVSVTAVVTLYAAEYNNEKVLKWNNRLYSVVRCYDKDTDFVEITCTDYSAAQEG